MSKPKCKITMPNQEFDELTEVAKKVGCGSLADFSVQVGSILADVEQIEENDLLGFQVKFKPDARSIILQNPKRARCAY